MNWSNLLSGAVGALIGAVGAIAAALITIDRTRKQELQRAEALSREAAERSRRERALEVSGKLADLLIQLYEGLMVLTLADGAPDKPLPIGNLRPLSNALRRAITVDAPFLGPELEAKMQNAREELKRVIGRQAETATRSDLELLLGAVKAAGDLLKELRRLGYAHIGPGASLGGLH